MNIVFKKDNTGLIFGYYPKKDFTSEGGKKSFYASTLDFLNGVSVTEDYIKTCKDATEQESKELMESIIKNNISDRWATYSDIMTK